MLITAVAFLEQVVAHYRQMGVTVERVMTDNGSCYKSAAFTGPVFVGEVSAFDQAKPVLVFGSANDVRITGGNLFQENAAPVEVSGIAQLQFRDGTDSHGNRLPAQPNRAVLMQDGQDVTAAIALNP